jgi:NADH-quinone oxidoreductase subunit E
MSDTPNTRTKLEVLEPEAEVEFSSEILDRIQELRGRYEDHRAAILPVLHAVMAEHGHLTLALERATAKAMDMPLAKVHEVVSFYTLFHTVPQGRCRVDICQTMSCMLRGARDLITHVKGKYGIEVGETTPDGKLTLHAVECLGNCEDAPVAQVGDDYLGPLTIEKLDEILEIL